MHSWSEEWLLKLNISKCKILSITRGMHSNSYGLNTGGGTSNDHIHEKLNKAYSMLGIIKRNFKHMDNVSFLYFFQFIHSFIKSVHKEP